MALVIDLRPDVEERLRDVADVQGVDPIELGRRLIEEHLPESEDPLIRLMLEWKAEDATDDPAELDRRDREWDDLKANLNANRAATGERLVLGLPPDEVVIATTNPGHLSRFVPAQPWEKIRP